MQEYYFFMLLILVKTKQMSKVYAKSSNDNMTDAENFDQEQEEDLVIIEKDPIEETSDIYHRENKEIVSRFLTKENDDSCRDSIGKKGILNYC